MWTIVKQASPIITSYKSFKQPLPPSPFLLEKILQISPVWADNIPWKKSLKKWWHRLTLWWPSLMRTGMENLTIRCNRAMIKNCNIGCQISSIHLCISSSFSGVQGTSKKQEREELKWTRKHVSWLLSADLFHKLLYFVHKTWQIFKFCTC